MQSPPVYSLFILIYRNIVKAYFTLDRDKTHEYLLVFEEN